MMRSANWYELKGNENMYEMKLTNQNLEKKGNHGVISIEER